MVDATGVFPGGIVRCACGADNEVPHAVVSAAASPYREAGQAPAPEPSPPVARRPRCPRCQAHLEGEARRTCPRCGGEFLPRDELGALVREADAEREADDPVAFHHAARDPARLVETEVHYLLCPGCGETMNRSNFGDRSGIVVDACKDHGTWFDRGELQAELSYVRCGGLEKARRERAARAAAPDPQVAREHAMAEVALAYERARQAEAVRRAANPRAYRGYRIDLLAELLELLR